MMSFTLTTELAGAIVKAEKVCEGFGPQSKEWDALVLSSCAVIIQSTSDEFSDDRSEAEVVLRSVLKREIES
jgi:hypothetical protein